MPDHPSWISAPKAAKADWLDLGCYCAKHKTDGAIAPPIVLKTCSRATRDFLVGNGRLHPPGVFCAECAELAHAHHADPPNGSTWHFHAYLKFNPSRRDLEELSQKRAAAGHLGGKAKAKHML